MKSADIKKRICNTRVMISIAGAAMLAGSGCAMMHTDTVPMAQLDVKQIQLAKDIKLSREGWPQAQWWHRYGDHQLDQLIDRAIKDAPMMAVVNARIQASRAQKNLAESTSGLLVGFSASLNRQDLSENSFLGPFAHNIPAEGLTGPWYTEGTIGFSGEYSFDVWGKDRARVEAAIGIQNARQAEAAEAELALSTRVAQTYFDIQAIYAALDLLEQAKTVETEMVAAHTARSQTGLESRTPIELTRVHLLELEKQISAAQTNIKLLRETMRALIGAGPDDLLVVNAVPLPINAGALPDSLGYELLARRPDLQAAHWYVQSSLSQVDMAKAAFYPSFDIKAFFGLDALHLEDLLHQSSKQLNLVPGLSLPVFDSGRLNAALSSAHTQSNSIIAQYNQAVVNAVKEVATNGIELKELDQQLELQQAKLRATQFALESAQAHHDQGLADRVTAIEAKLPVLVEQEKMVALRHQQINTDIALTHALGGGYDASKVARGMQP